MMKPNIFLGINIGSQCRFAFESKNTILSDIKTTRKHAHSYNRASYLVGTIKDCTIIRLDLVQCPNMRHKMSPLFKMLCAFDTISVFTLRWVFGHGVSISNQNNKGVYTTCIQMYRRKIMFCCLYKLQLDNHNTIVLTKTILIDLKFSRADHPIRVGKFSIHSGYRVGGARKI